MSVVIKKGVVAVECKVVVDPNREHRGNVTTDTR